MTTTIAPMKESLYLSTVDDLSDFCDRAFQSGRIALDCEFMRDRTYFAKLALVQVGLEDDFRLIDPTEVTDLSPLEDLLLDPQVTKVVHAGAQDLEIFFDRTQRVAVSIFDTQLAAAMVGIGQQVALATLVFECLGIPLSKGESYTDWLRRPLSPKQEDYALDDVRYLLPLHDELTKRLDELDRFDWLDRELERFEHESFFRPDPREAYRNVKRSGTLDRQGLAGLRELAAWRELEARRRDRPRRSIISDETLVEIARRGPKNLAQLKSIRGLHPSEASRSQRAILTCVRAAKDLPKAQWPKTPRKSRPSPDAEALADLLSTVLRVLSAKQSIAPGLLASAADLISIAEASTEGLSDLSIFELFRDKRYDLVGREIERFLDGQLSLAVENGSATLVELRGTP